MPFVRLCLLLTLALSNAAVHAENTWQYDMLVSRKIIGEQTLRQVPNESGSILIQTTDVEKKGWFSSFTMQGITVEQLSESGNSVAMQTRVTANGRTWWSQLSPTGNGHQGVGRDMGELSAELLKNLTALDQEVLAEQPLPLPKLQAKTAQILDGVSGEQQATLVPEKKFVTSLNALPYYLKQMGRIPGSLQLIDNEGLQVINSPIVDLGTQSMEIGGKHYTARHIKVAKADAGTHIWYNEGDTGPVVLMIAGKSGKKNFQISLKEKQLADE